MELAINPPDGRSAAPLYVQIAREIRRALERDGLSGGERLPTIRELASHLKVHRDTVGLAYERLVKEGVLDTQVGRGTFVASPTSQTHAFEPNISPLVLRLLDHHQAHTGDPIPDDTIAFHALVPDPAHFPVDSFRRSLNKALSEQGADLLGYGGEAGDAGLRQVIAAHLGEHGIRGGADGVITCQGASQGIALAARAFTEPGDAVLVEEPTYQNALGILVGLGLRPEPVPLRQDAPAGVDLEAVARGLARPEVKAFYTIPTFHNPTGITTSLEHREKLLEIARRSGKPIIEDACTIDLRFRGRDVAPLAALDDSGLVVPLFSFSKSLFPGIRCGAVVARGRTEAAIRTLKRFSDLGGALPLQAAVASFVRSGHYRRHLQRLRGELAGRCDAMLRALAKHMPTGVTWVTPEGGYQVWVDLPEGFDARAVYAAALRAGVLITPGDQFQSGGGPSRSFRLVFAQSSPAEIESGVSRLAAAIRSEGKRKKPTERAAIG